MKNLLLKDIHRRFLTVPGQPLDPRFLTETDPEKLGLALKLRLAAHAPVYRSTTKGNRIYVIARHFPIRHVPVYEISEEQDPSLLVSIKVKCVGDKEQKDP